MPTLAPVVRPVDGLLLAGAGGGAVLLGADEVVLLGPVPTNPAPEMPFGPITVTLSVVTPGFVGASET